ncbi:hypothetical protein COCHEDRAFT_1191701 [Bipolaris maydis C5]|uniref:Radical SAM core domain-containing protein n=2 Tax=Cochliobolus heterostrophus TaxID=5016 RepID=M2TBL1_COCH5|nr:hypothetical protein COCHEDRAFT_1191701 [Bipolaris maydis C5]
MMAHMARVRAGPQTLRRVAGRGELSARSPISAIRTRCIATDTETRESASEFLPGIDPVPIPQRSGGEDRRAAIKNAKPFSAFLTDTFNRQHDYLRISITERCNLRCLYCMPEEGVPLSPSANMLTTPEIFYLSSLFVSQGVTKIRLTGGEPTVRRDIVPLMQQIGSLRPKGLRELALTTNGISLHRKLDAMVEAGLTGVNLSLDTLDPFQFQIMTRRKGFDAVMKSIDRILEMNKLGANVKLKVNCVVMRGLNEREILPFVEMGREKDIEVRFIEYMPFGGNKWSENKMISFQEMLDIIRVKYPGLRPVPGHKNDTSKTYEVPGFVGKVGFITSMTNDFCGSCNRLRITSDGNLKVCLHGNAEVSLRDVLRQGNNGEPIDQEAFERIRKVEMDRHDGRLSDDTILGWGQRERELLEVVGAAVKRKAEKHADLEDLASMENRPMILIGGTNKRPSLHRDLDSQVFHDSTARKMYSTSSRSILPDLDLASQQKEKEKDDGRELPEPYLPHLTPSGSAHMVSVSTKQHTIRTAIAIGSVHFTNSTPLSLIRSNTAKKGDVLGVSRIAGIMAAKKCPDLVPLCHPIPLTHVSVELAPFSDGHGGVKIEAKVQCTGQTGVEMEALTAVMGAALSVVDMCKAVDRFQRVDGVRVVFKEGGKSGVWREEGWESWQE